MSDTISDTLHEQLNQLRTIAKIQSGQKLSLANGRVSIYTDKSYTGWLWRVWYGDSREETIKFLQKLYKSINEISRQLSDSLQTGDIDHCIGKAQVAKNLLAELVRAKDGLENLAKTYHAYPDIVSRIEGIIIDYSSPAIHSLASVDVQQASDTLDTDDIP